MDWIELARMSQQAVLTHLGEDGFLDGVPARFATLNPDETYDIGETEYHGQVRKFALLEEGAPAYAVGSLVQLRSRLFEVTAIVQDGEGMAELVTRERDPKALDAATVMRLRSVAVVDASTLSEPSSTATIADWFDWLDMHGITDVPQPGYVAPIPYAKLRWLDRHLLRGAE